MAGGETKRRKRQTAWDVPVQWLIAGGAFSICLAFTGWMLALDETSYSLGARIEESLYRSLSVNTLSDTYSRPIDDVRDEPVAAFLLLVARWLGAVVFFTTLFKVVVSLFLEGILTWICKRTWRDHIVVIGDRDFAYEIATSAADAGLHVVHFYPGGKETVRDGILSRDSGIGIDAVLEESAAHRARSLVFADSDNAAGLDLATSVFNSQDFDTAARKESTERLPGNAARRGPHIYVCVDDSWFEHREELDYSVHKVVPYGQQAEDGALDSVVELISESRCAARAVLAAHPVFTLSERRRQHIVLVGFGAIGEALLTEICETQRIDPDRQQVFTIIDPDGASWARFTQRCPEWNEVLDGVHISLDLNDPQRDLTELSRRLAEAPPTAAYIATGDDTDPAILAARLKQTIARLIDEETLVEDEIAFPIFTCVRGGRESASSHVRLDTASDSSAVLSRMPVVAFGAWGDIVMASRILEKEPDRAAFAVHTVHNELYSDTPPTNWSHVPEVNRYSSRSAAAFVPGLIHAAGFDLQPWLAAHHPLPPSVNELPSPAPGRSLAEDPSELVYLARLEHLRWCAERRLRGFQHAARKDVNRRRHPDLVTFDQLPQGSQVYNIRYIGELSNSLARQSAQVYAPERPDALRVLVRPTDFVLLEAAGLAPSSTPARETKELN
ncbi:MAG: hypothetical protein AAF216_00160 [Pseudomonadota bacterium]